MFEQVISSAAPWRSMIVRVFGRPAKGMMHIEDRLAIAVVGSGNRLVARDRVPESLTLRADLNGRQLLMPLPHSLNGGNVGEDRP
jgi:hypothetical protein